jgi:hypothetical protein
MGLRSPQQLERAKTQAAKPNQTEVKPFQDTSLTDAVNTGMNAYNVEYQRNLRKNTIAKTSFKNQINAVAKEAEARLGGLEGDDVITKAPEIMKATQKEYKKLFDNVPPDLQGVFEEEKKKADINLNSKYLVKSYIEESKRVEKFSAQNIKTAMDELSNKISLIQDGNQGTAPEFREKVGELDSAVRDSFISKGFDVKLRAEELKQEQIKVRSKALLQGIETFAASKRPDLIASAEKAFKAYGDSPNFMTPSDRESAYKALLAGKESADGEIAYQLATEAMSKENEGKSLNELIGQIVSKTNTTDVTSRAVSLTTAWYEAKNVRAKNEKNAADINAVYSDLLNNKPEEALKKISLIKDKDASQEAFKVFNAHSRGNFYSDPATLKKLEDIYLFYPEGFDKLNLDREALSPQDREMWRTKQQIAAKKKSDSRYGLVTGKYLDDTVSKVMNTIPMLYLQERGKVMHPTEVAKNRLNAERLYWQVIGENPLEFNQSVIERKVLDLARRDMYSVTPKKIGDWEVPKEVDIFGVKIPVPFSGDKVEPNPNFGADPMEPTPEQIQMYKKKYPKKSEQEIRDAYKAVKSRQK